MAYEILLAKDLKDYATWIMSIQIFIDTDTKISETMIGERINVGLQPLFNLIFFDLKLLRTGNRKTI